MNVNFICRPYTSADQELTKNFSSGNRYLDAFIADPQSALDTSYGKTYIFLFEDSHEIIGYYNITAGSGCYSGRKDAGQKRRVHPYQLFCGG